VDESTLLAESRHVAEWTRLYSILLVLWILATLPGCESETVSEKFEREHKALERQVQAEMERESKAREDKLRLVRFEVSDNRRPTGDLNRYGEPAKDIQRISYLEWSLKNVTTTPIDGTVVERSGHTRLSWQDKQWIAVEKVAGRKNWSLYRVDHGTLTCVTPRNREDGARELTVRLRPGQTIHKRWVMWEKPRKSLVMYEQTTPWHTSSIVVHNWSLIRLDTVPAEYGEGAFQFQVELADVRRVQ
jgi:hypothetical protein